MNDKWSPSAELAGKVLAEEQRPLDSQSWSKWWPPATPKTQPDPRPRAGRGPPLPACCLHQGVRLKRASILPQERSPPPRVNLGPRVVNYRLLAPSHGAAGGGKPSIFSGPFSHLPNVSLEICFAEWWEGSEGSVPMDLLWGCSGPFQGHRRAGSGPQG